MATEARTKSKADTREAILVAAKKHFQTLGYEKAKLRDIAEEAGFTTGSIYAAFADKETLWLHAIGRDAPDARKFIERAKMEMAYTGLGADAATLLRDLYGPEA